MDTTDPGISFNVNGVCDYCVGFEKNIKPNWHTDHRGRRSLEEVSQGIRASAKNPDYDCIIGLSGGQGAGGTKGGRQSSGEETANEKEIRPLVGYGRVQRKAEVRDVEGAG